MFAINEETQRREPLIVRLSPAMSGACFGGAWWALIWVQARFTAGLGTSLEPRNAIPPTLGFLGFCMTLMTPAHALRERGQDDVFVTQYGGCARCWVFSAFVVLLAGLMVGGVLGTLAADTTTGQVPQGPTAGDAGATACALLLLMASLFWLARKIHNANFHSDIF